MRIWALVALFVLADPCAPAVAPDPGEPDPRLHVTSVGPGTFSVLVSRGLTTLVNVTGQTEFNELFSPADDEVYLEATPEPGARFVGWSGATEGCTGTALHIEFRPPDTGGRGIECTATFEGPPLAFTVFFLPGEGGTLQITDAAGETSCAPADAPCEAQIEGDTVTVEGLPSTSGFVTFFDPPCAAGPGDTCVFDLDTLDTDGDHEVSIGAAFTDPSLRYTLLIETAGGTVETIDVLGDTTSCAPADAPCEVEVPGDVVFLEGSADTDGALPLFDPPCPAGPGDHCVFHLASLDTDGDFIVSIGATFAVPTPYTFELTVAGEGEVEVTGAAGGPSTCAPSGSPCELLVPGRTVRLLGRPRTSGHVTTFEPLCPMGPGNRCDFDLLALDADGDHHVAIRVTFAPPSPVIRLDACVGLRFEYEEAFGGAMYQVAPDGRCVVVRNDGAVLGTFAISGGNGFGGDGSLAIAGIVAASEWLPSGDLTSLEVDGAPPDRLQVPVGRASSQEVALGFASGMRFVVRIDGTPGPTYTRVTQTVLDATRRAE